MRLIECVPNISEGRDQMVIRPIVMAVAATADVNLLDWSADPDHNRLVLTYVGEPAAVMPATVSGPTLPFVNGMSPKFSMNKAWAPPRS